MKNRTCIDCGTVVPATTASAETRTGRLICFDCCAKRDIEEMKKTGKHSGLYITTKPGTTAEEVYSNAPLFHCRQVINWPGTLRFDCIGLKQSRHGGGFNSQRTDVWFIGPDGYIWHGVNRGDMDLTRCKRTKQKPMAQRVA